MSIHFFGWEVVDDGASFPGGELESSQVPKKGGVYTMYHGTSVKNASSIIINGFKQSTGGMLGKGVYVSRDIKKAAGYPRHSSSSDRVVLIVLARLGRVKRIDKDNHSMQLTWQANGYNTAWVPPNCGMQAVPSGLEEDCIYDPKRVKVIGIANAPSPKIRKDLEELIAKKVDSHKKGASAVDTCTLCMRKTQEGSKHINQKCWQCGETICILMSKHFCKAKGSQGKKTA